MQHYFVNEKLNNSFVLDKDDQHHIINVMRMNNNDEIICVFEEKQYLCSISISNKNVETSIIKELETNNELNTNITLIYGMPKSEKFELVLQKACELGVSKVVPFMSSKSIVKLDDNKIDKKIERWEKIVKEACEQSRRNKLLKIEKPIKINKIKDYKEDFNFICNENEHYVGTKGFFELMSENDFSDKGICVVVGCEGGFTNDEIVKINEMGYENISLGKRILRSESAAIAVLANLAFMLERKY